MTRSIITNWIVFWLGTLAALGWGWYSYKQSENSLASEQGIPVSNEVTESPPATPVPQVASEHTTTRREVVNIDGVCCRRGAATGGSGNSGSD